MPKWDGLKDPETYTNDERAALATEAIRWINRFRYVQGVYNSDDSEQGLLAGAILSIKIIAQSSELTVNSIECEGCDHYATEFDDAGTPLCLGHAWDTAQAAREDES